jgi:iron complex outermembrane receptor protein
VDNYEIGVRGRWQNLQASLSGFYNYSDLGTSFRRIGGSDVGRTVRSPQRIYGVEAALNWQPGKDWQLGGTISWQEGENDASENGEFLAPA